MNRLSRHNTWLAYFFLTTLCSVITWPHVAVSAQQVDSPIGHWKFDFGVGSPAQGWIKVGPDSTFSIDRGYGFDLGSPPRSVARQTDLETNSERVIPDPPFFFSVQLPEGNYRVKITFGDAAKASLNTVKAESRRLMLEQVETEAGKFETREFIVNIRTPNIPDGRSVGLKKREVGVLHWDEKLTLEFNGLRPAICSLEISPADVPTVYLLGDSTVTDQPREPWNSWGQMLTRFFDTTIAVANHAESGESLKSSINARRIKKVFSTLRKGDYLVVQFGHNDMKDPSPDALQTYRLNLEKLIDDTLQRGATPILVTSMERKSGVNAPTLKNYPQTVRDIAQAKKTALIDLNQSSVVLYRAMGKNLDKLFQDGTHHNAFGSYQMAKCVVQGIRDNVPKLALHLRPETPAFDPGSPDNFKQFKLPPSPNTDPKKPDGN